MKTRNFLAFLAIGCLFSCQQNEQQDQDDAIINFSMSIDNDNLETALTRTGISSLYTGKTFFSTGDVISMATSDFDYSSFTIGKDIRTWNEIETNENEVKFYAHYPELTISRNQSKRNLKGGKELLFGVAKATIGTSGSINLQFKRMTIPVIIVEVDEEGRVIKPYDGDGVIKLHVKNQGTQDLNEGTITVDLGAKSEEVAINKLASGELTNLLPQKISMGSDLASLSVGGETQTFKARSSFSLNSGSTLVVKVFRDKDSGYNVIVDGDVPLRR